MKRRRIILILAGTALFLSFMPQSAHSISVHADTTQIAYGDLVEASIDVAGEQDIYTFDGTSGDFVLIRTTESGSRLESTMELLDPNGNSLATASQNGVAELRIILEQTGAYTLSYSDDLQNSDSGGGDGTGSYRLFLQRTFEPGNATEISYGEMISGRIDPSGDVDTYTFDGSEGEEVILRAAEFGSRLEATLELFAPAGQSLLLRTAGTLNEVRWTLEEQGPYTLLVSDDFQNAPSGGDGTGDYNLFLERFNNPANFTEIAYGDLQQVSIEVAGERDIYTFDGSAGDLILIRATDSGSRLETHLALFAPDGDTLATAAQNGVSELRAALLQDGTHRIFVNDDFGGTGSYRLFLQRTFEPGNATEISYGEMISGRIDPSGDVDTYTFDGSEGEEVILRAAEFGSRLEATLELFAPAGQSLLLRTAGTLNEVRWTLEEQGPYTLLVSDDFQNAPSGGDGTGDYWLGTDSQQHLKAIADTLRGEGSIEASLDYVKRDAYVFLVSQDGVANLKMTRISGSLDPQMELYGPDGELVVSTSDASSAEIDDSYFAESGAYLLIVSDDLGNDTGSYQLTWSGLLEGALIQVTSIDAPTGIIALGQSVTPRATFTNIGWQEERFTATFQILDVYEDQIENAILLPGESLSVDFASWTPTVAAAYPFSCSSSTEMLLGGDTEEGVVIVSSGSGPEIHAIEPSVGVNGGLFTMRISGSRFEPGLTARLSMANRPDLIADPSGFISAEEVDVTFDLSDALEGVGDVTVFNPDGTSYTFFEGFTVVEFEGQEIAFGQWEEFGVAKGTMIEVGVSVPSGIDELFLLIKKATRIGYAGTWAGSVRLLRQGEEVAFKSGNNDFEIHIQDAESGFYTIEIASSDPGDGLIRVDASLDPLELGQWTVGEVLRPVGWDWKQVDVPPNQASVFFQADGIGIWNTLTIFYDHIGNEDQRWEINRPGAGYHLEGEIENPPAGRYYLRYMDSAVIRQGSSQVRDYLIIADTEPIFEAPPVQPVITDLSVYAGGRGGNVSVVISGAGLDANATVALVREGFEDIMAWSVLGDSTKLSLTATFDFTEAEPGAWTLMVTNPDDQSATAPRSFIIEESTGEPNLWVEIVGPEKIRIGRNQRYIIRFGNQGNVDAVDNFIIIDLPLGFEYSINLPLPDIEGIDWTQIPDGFEDDGRIVIPIWIFNIPSNITREIELTLRTNSASALSKLHGSSAQTFIRTRITSSNYTCTTRAGIRECIGETKTFERVTGDLNDYFDSLPGYTGTLQGLRDALLGWMIDLGTGTYVALSVGAVVGAFCTVSPQVCTAAVLAGVGAAAVGAMSAASSFQDTMAEALHGLEPVSSSTPEDKYGPTGFDIPGTSPDSLLRFVSPQQPFEYRIEFWNKEDATAPAQEVFVRDTLDTHFADSGFNFLEFGFLKWTVPLSGGHYFNVDVDLRPDMNLIVNAEGKYDQDSREVSWTFRSLDPSTGDLPEDPLAGFLPPITASGFEIGWVTYSVQPQPGLQTGTRLSNQAFVNFDGVGPWNPAPPNPDSERPGLGPWVNTLDIDVPASMVFALADTQNVASFDVQWTGTDFGSGILDYTIYVSEDGGAFTAWLRNTADTSATFTGQSNTAYAFYSVARDGAGNREAVPFAADAVTMVPVSIEGADEIPRTFSLWQNYPNPFNPTTTIVYELPRPERVRLHVYDILGREVAVLVDEEMLPGRHTVVWEPGGFASGVYFYRIQAGDYTKTKKLLFIK